MVGTGIESIRRRQEREQQQNAGRPKNAKDIQKGNIIYEPLNTTVSSVNYDVFILGVHNPDTMSGGWVL